MRRVVLTAIAVLSLAGSLSGQPLKVSGNGRYLLTPDDKPFFWLGDTAWELFHRLDREEAVTYLDNRAAKGFNVIQAVLLPELEPFEIPNAYGDFPLIGRDIAAVNVTDGSDPDDANQYDYWDHAEFIIAQAAKRNLMVGLLPCWGEYVTPRFTDRVIRNPAEGYAYGWFVGNRFKGLNSSVIWILGGDRLPDERESGVATWRAMAEGISDALSGIRSHDGKADYTRTFMTYHCYTSSSTWFHRDEWIDMHTWGSYHEKRDNERAYHIAYHDWILPDPKPTLNSEPAYELSAVNYDWQSAALGYFDDFDVRQVAYWSVFSGACGHTYGCSSVWRMYKKENAAAQQTRIDRKSWNEVLDEPGAAQMPHLKDLVLSRPFLARRPNQALLAENPHDPVGRLVACCTDGCAMVYIPTGKKVCIDLAVVPAKGIKPWWFDPRSGKAVAFESFVNDMKVRAFDPPGDTGRGNDWVLVLDDESKSFGPPGRPLSLQ